LSPEGLAAIYSGAMWRKVFIHTVWYKDFQKLKHHKESAVPAIKYGLQHLFCQFP
jgi:hypothetical protein